MDITTKTERHPIKIALSGDAHLRDRQYVRASRSIDFFEAKKRLIEKAAEEGADIILDTGDLIDTSRPSANIVRQLVSLDRALRALKLHMLTVSGNHDWSRPSWLHVLFGDTAIGDGGIIVMDDARVTYKGYAFQGLRPHSPAGLRDNAEQHRAMCNGADVVLMHATVNGVVESDMPADRMLDVSELPYAENVKFIALGDIHICGFVERNNCLVGYPGSSEMCSASEPKEKVLPMVRLSDDGAELLRKVPLVTRPFITGTIKSTEDADELVSRIEAVKDQHPVVVAKFDREFHEVINRVHNILDAQRAIIRFEPLPLKKEYQSGQALGKEQEAVSLASFVAKKFPHDEQRQELLLALELLERGEDDAANIVSDFIERRQKELAVRE